MSNIKDTLVISAFPCIGKSFYTENQKNFEIVLDSDSSKFSWISLQREQQGYVYSAKKRNPDFPQNYINYIKNQIGKVDIIFVSSHSEVREALQKNNIAYYLVYPVYNMRNDFVGRSICRGNTLDFALNIKNNWDEWYNYTLNSYLTGKEMVFWCDYNNYYMDKIIKNIIWSKNILKNEDNN